MFFLKAIHQDDETLGNVWSQWGSAFASSAPRSSGIDWNAIISRGFDLGSQAMQSFGGRTVGTQTYGSSGQVFAINSQPQSGGYASGFDGSAYAQQIAALQAQRSGGLGFDDAAGSVVSFISRNPLLVGGVVLGAYLLFREPPKRR